MMPKILLIEDNEMNRDMLSRRLQRRGYRVITAQDGEQGHLLASSESPDLILMDISLPAMDGWELTRRLKADRKSTRLNSSHRCISYAVFCLQKKNAVLAER